MKTLQFDEDMAGYVEYAAAIERKTVKNYLTALHRRYTKRCHYNDQHGFTPITLQRFVESEVWMTIDSYEWRNRLPQSYAQSRNPRESTLNRCYDNMLLNRAALAV